MRWQRGIIAIDSLHDLLLEGWGVAARTCVLLKTSHFFLYSISEEDAINHAETETETES